jgi:Leucine-rich repeat (LRR) protein
MDNIYEYLLFDKNTIIIDVDNKSLKSLSEIKWKQKYKFKTIIVRANNNNLTDLQGIPNYIAPFINELYVNENKITSLKGCPLNLSKLCVNFNYLKDLKGIAPNLIELFAQYNLIESTMFLPQSLKRLLISNKIDNGHIYINKIKYYLPNLYEFNNFTRTEITNLKLINYKNYKYIYAYYVLSKYLYKDLIKYILSMTMILKK